MESEEENEDVTIGDIVYCGKFNLVPESKDKSSFNMDIFIVNKKTEKESTYEMYSKDGAKIATVDTSKKLTFTPERNRVARRLLL